MTAVGQTTLATSATRIRRAGASAAALLSHPRTAPVVRRLAVILLCLWVLVSLWRAILSFIPEAPPLPSTDVINPMTPTSTARAEVSIDIDRLAAAPLFGVALEGADAEALVTQSGRSPTMSENEAAEALAGIEDGAPATRLPLRLRGVVAASEAGLGQAVIEHQNIQDLYQVGDELPVSGQVALAKVLPELVVLDNGGRYETLQLFEETELTRQASAIASAAGSSASRTPVAVGPTRGAAQSPNAEEVIEDSSAIAARYRERLYDDPESLADVVLVSAVRDDGNLRGYRVMPGRAADEFAALGFRAGDVVTAVNGLSLAEPANTMRLYQTMRSATSASFELERDGEAFTLDVALGSTGSQP